MLNLLPPQEKEQIKALQKKNLITVFFFTVTLALICLVLILLSLKFYLLIKINDGKFVLEDTKKMFQSPESLKLQEQIKEYNSLMPTILNFYKTNTNTSGILIALSKIQKPSGVQFNIMTIDNATDVSRITVNGIADTRENLLIYKKNLESSLNIKNIVFSPESWISPTKANFNINFDFIRNEK